MQLTIKETTYDLYFGLGFVREMDAKHFSTNIQGVRFGQGIEKGATGVLIGDPVILSDILHAATVTERKRPSQLDVDKYLDTLTPEQLAGLFDEVNSELKKANTMGPRLQELETVLQSLNPAPKEKTSTKKS